MHSKIFVSPETQHKSNKSVGYVSDNVPSAKACEVRYQADWDETETTAAICEEVLGWSWNITRIFHSKWFEAS